MTDVLVVGAGPAGIAAACAAAESGASVTVVDDNPSPGGQIWRRGSGEWVERMAASGASALTDTIVLDRADDRVLLTTRGEIAYRKLIVATGARELFLPFPGWTLPHVMGAGGLQALVKGGWPVEGKRIVVAGSGPLLLAVAAYLQEQGATVPVIAEQAPEVALAAFTAALLRWPRKVSEAVRMRWKLRGTRYLAGTWVVNAEHGSATLSSGERIECDYLAAGFGLTPNTELPSLLGCAMQGRFVAVDERQQTSVNGVFCAGEPTGIGGLDLALATGQIAGYAAAGRPDRAREWFPARQRAREFQRSMERAFELRPDLREIATSATLVCRCEDVPLGALLRHQTWRAAKLQTRCGMGPCQGRVCRPAVEFLLGWRDESVRPPLFPMAVSGYAAASRASAAGPSRPGS